LVVGLAALDPPYSPWLPASAGETVAPAKRTLAIPVRGIRVAGAPRGPGEWLVDFGPVAPVSALAFGPDGKTLAVGGYREVLLWDLAEARLAKRLGGGKLAGQVRGVAWSADGQLLAAAAGSPGGPAAVELFDPQTGQSLASLAGPKDEVLSLALSADGKLLAAGAADGAAYVWSLESKQLVATLTEHGDWVLGVAFSPDGKFLATAGADKSVRLWDPATWKSESRFPQGEPVQGVAFSPDATAMALALGGPSAASQSIRIRRKPAVQAPSPKAKEKPAPPPPSQEQYPQQAAPLDLAAAVPQGIVWNRKGTRIYVPTSDKTVKVVAPAAGRITASLAGHADWVYAVAISPDGSKLASGGADGTVRLWDAGGESLIATLMQLAAGTDEWLIVTADGAVSGSSTGCLRWKGADPAAAAQQPDGSIANPDAVKAALTARTEAPAATPAARSKPAPKVPRPKGKTP
jgi:WD40 repeat protein